MSTATIGSGTFGSGTFGDPAEHVVKMFTDAAGATDTAAVHTVRRVAELAGATDTARIGVVLVAVDDAGSADGTLTANLRVLLDEAGATDTLRLGRGQRLVEAADSAGADDAVTLVLHRRRTFADEAGAADAVTLVLHRRWTFADEMSAIDTAALVIDRCWTFSERAGARDTVSVNGVLAGSGPFTTVAGELGADRIIIRDAPLTTRTRHGGQTRDWDAATAVIADGCSVQAYGATEQAADREFTATHKRLFAPADVTLAATSQVIFDGATYEVDGEPALWRDLDGRPSHIEAALKRLSG